MAEVCANVAALAKVTDKTTLMTVINGAVRPLVQLNVPEGFLNPLEDVRAPVHQRKKSEKKSEKPCYPQSPMPPVSNTNHVMAPPEF